MAEASAERAAWLAIARVPRFPAAALDALLHRFGDAAAVLEAGRAAWREAGLAEAAVAALSAPDRDGLERDQRWLEADDAHLLTWADPAYPDLLRQIPDPPAVLFVRGDPQVLRHPQLAIVGSRNPSPGGRETAADFARHLAGAGLAITSGLALGVDAAAHGGALAAGLTVAVAGTGLDRVYPARHRELAHAIAGRGALVSEYPSGVPPLPANFPRRNRLISGLSLGTLVVEAALHSGSLITARLAVDQGREVFAIPGSIHNPLARGCHRLLRDGAKLVETAQDILEELEPLFRVSTSVSVEQAPAGGGEPQDFCLDADYMKVLENVGHEPTPVDLVVARTGLTAEAVCSMLLVLELHGHVQSAAGGRYSRAR